jgi:hypothetical protein
MVDWLLNGLIEWLAGRVQGMLGGLVSFLTATFFTSPDVTVFPQVQGLASRSSLVVNAAFVLAIIAAGAIGMTHGTFQIRYEVKDLLPRLVFSFVASNFGVEGCRMLIEAANALTVTMVGETASGPKVVEFVKARIVSALTDPAAALLAVVIGLIIVALFYMLAVSWFARIAALIVLAGIAPVALACYCLPQTQVAAQLWWRSLVGCLSIPLLQAVFFSTGVNLLLDPTVNVPILLGIGPAPSLDVFNLFIAASLLWLTVGIPKLVGRYVTRSGQVSTAGVMLRAMAVQAITRRLRVPVRRPGG